MGSSVLYLLKNNHIIIIIFFIKFSNKNKPMITFLIDIYITCRKMYVSYEND